MSNSGKRVASEMADATIRTRHLAACAKPCRALSLYPGDERPESTATQYETPVSLGLSDYVEHIKRHIAECKKGNCLCICQRTAILKSFIVTA